MDESLRKACPCLEALWKRIFVDKDKNNGRGGEGREGEGEREGEEGLEEEGRGGDGGVVGGNVGGNEESQHVDIGSIFTALYPFEGRQQGELSFQEGDLFNVIDRSGDWWSARKIDMNGRVLDTGLVPSNYVARAESVETQPWYFGQMNRFEAQNHLMGPDNKDGAFLVRFSEKTNVGYVLSVRSGLRVKHFKILQEGDSQFWVDPDQQFTSLIDLVEFYSHKSLTDIGTLRNTCKRKPPKPAELSPFPDEWELPQEEFTKEELLGRGYFADVYRGRWKNRINVAIKIIKSDSELDHSEFLAEVQILKTLRHRHLISLFAVCTAHAPYYIITELMEKGSLVKFLRDPEGQNLDVPSLIDMGAQVADGMSYLEEKNSIHRDLAARNVLVGENYICKVADFGLARVIKERLYITDDKRIPYKWSAPEAISHGRFSSKSDVWSFGVLLYEIITYGGVPYPAFSNNEVYQKVISGYRMPAPPKCPDFLYDIMLKCWSAEPDDRPDFQFLRGKLDSSSYDLE